LVGTAEVEPDVRPAIWGPIFPLLLGLLSENKTLYFEADVESIENRSVPIFKASSAVVGGKQLPIRMLCLGKRHKSTLSTLPILA
jgi:hypothetical protein